MQSVVKRYDPSFREVNKIYRNKSKISVYDGLIMRKRQDAFSKTARKPLAANSATESSMHI